jgi:hypothetical protein
MKFEILEQLATMYDMPDNLPEAEFFGLCAYFDKRYYEMIYFFD